LFCNNFSVSIIKIVLYAPGGEAAGAQRPVAHCLQTAAGKRISRFVVPERRQLRQVGQVAPAADGERRQEQVKRRLCFTDQCQK